MTTRTAAAPASRPFTRTRLTWQAIGLAILLLPLLLGRLANWAGIRADT